MLEFTAMLFVRLAPNETAWCDTLAMFLSKRGYTFDAKDSLRRRFGTALHQYQVLVRVVNAEMDKQIGLARQEVLSRDPFEREDVISEVIPLPKIDVTTPITHRLYVSALSSDGLIARKHTTSGSTPDDRVNGHSLPSPTTAMASHDGSSSPSIPNMHASHSQRRTPSDYMRSRCPLCAGAGGQTRGSKL
jgi:hypothetical protein